MHNRRTSTRPHPLTHTYARAHVQEAIREVEERAERSRAETEAALAVARAERERKERDEADARRQLEELRVSLREQEVAGACVRV
jgi:hypothetical protein